MACPCQFEDQAFARALTTGATRRESESVCNSWLSPYPRLRCFAPRLASVPDGASVSARTPRLKLRPAIFDWRSWLPTWSVAAAMRAARAAIVIPSLFAITLLVIDNAQMALFAAFGGFATLVLASFGGTRRDKLLSHLGLAVVGSVLIVIGTAVQGSTVIAALVTLPVAFAVFFVGYAGPNEAGGVTAALLAYVLPASSPGTMGMVPDRLAGWWLVSVAGTVAVLVLSPRSEGDRLRTATSTLASTLGDALEAVLAGSAPEAAIEQCIASNHELLSVFTATPYRPVGLAAVDQALANAVELLSWCTSLVIDGLREQKDLEHAPETERDLLLAAARMLGDVASLLDGKDADPDFDGLERCRERSKAWLASLPADGPTFRDEVRLSFHAHTIAVAARSVACAALVAARKGRLDTAAMRDRFDGLVGAAGIALRNASVRSVWFINSARGALALAAAVAVADLSNVQHGFWVVLGTLSVLRTNATATGATALRALGGTLIGFVIGALLLLAIGTSTAALWVTLVLAVVIAGYAPGTSPFAIGQASFTIVVVVLFNLLVPVGWTVGLLRIQDVAIGCAVSLVVGILFWPRGTSGVVGNDLGDAFRQGARYLSEAVDWVLGLRSRAPAGATATATAATRLDDALRGFLAEQGSKRVKKIDLWRLIGGSLRLRLTAHALAGLPNAVAEVDGSREALSERTLALEAWYDRLATYVGRPQRGPLEPLTVPALADISGSADPLPGHRACYAIWVEEHLAHLSEHLGELAESATHLAEVRRRPWWR